MSLCYEKYLDTITQIDIQTGGYKSAKFLLLGIR